MEASLWNRKSDDLVHLERDRLVHVKEVVATVSPAAPNLCLCRVVGSTKLTGKTRQTQHSNSTCVIHEINEWTKQQQNQESTTSVYVSLHIPLFVWEFWKPCGQYPNDKQGLWRPKRKTLYSARPLSFHPFVFGPLTLNVLWWKSIDKKKINLRTYI